MVRKLVALVALAALLPLLAPSGAAPPSWRSWEGPGIVVSSFDLVAGQITVVDNGAVVCRLDPTKTGAGGNCLPFGALAGANAIAVKEACSDICPPANSVAFQVCVDNNGDGICRGLSDVGDDVPAFQPSSCADDTILYSHSTTTNKNRGALHVPAWVQTFWQSCGGLGYPGYVVITCAGLHDNKAGTNLHTHTARAGLLGPAFTNDHTTGNYCGAPTAAKAYVVA